MDNRPRCNLRCTVCKKPDCDYDGDYISRTERDTAKRNDKRAIWYRKTWAQISKEGNRHLKGKMKDGSHEALSSHSDGKSDHTVL